MVDPAVFRVPTERLELVERLANDREDCQDQRAGLSGFFYGTRSFGLASSSSVIASG